MPVGAHVSVEPPLVGWPPTGASEKPITPILVGEAATAHAFSRALLDAGLLATAIGFPTVRQGKARIRMIVTATRAREQLDRAAEILERTATDLWTLD